MFGFDSACPAFDGYSSKNEEKDKTTYSGKGYR